MHKQLLAIMSAAILSAGMALPAVAAPPSGSSAMSKSATPTHVSQAKLKKFAAAYQDVTNIRNKYTAKLQNANNKKKAQSIASQAQQEMKAAIRNHGFTIKSYSKIVRAVNSNPKLQKRFMKLTGNTGKSG